MLLVSEIKISIIISLIWIKIDKKNEVEQSYQSKNLYN